MWSRALPAKGDCKLRGFEQEGKAVFQGKVNHTALMARKHTAVGLGQAMKKPVACCARTRVLGQKFCSVVHEVQEKTSTNCTTTKLHDLNRYEFSGIF